MCGIVGFAGQGDALTLRRMADAVAHRGPDAEGFFVDDLSGVHLGHKRLAILDLAGGEQPMWNEDGSVCIIFNGEIYNHRALRHELVKQGHQFHSDHSDTEVLVHGYEEWGDALPEKLNGMFAFAIWDAPRKRIFLARDRFGKKPLYYSQGKGFLGFASEIRSLLQHPAVGDELDELALKKYFAYSYIPSPLTPFRGIRKLPGGSFLIYDTEGRTSVIEKYWRFRIQPDDFISSRNEDELGEELFALLQGAVQRRLESDAPLGFLLSGGIDSAAVLGLAAKSLPPERLNTFSLGFDEASFDESAYAEFMARQVGSCHQTQFCSLEEVRSELPGLLARWDEPIGDSSILPTFMVCRFARQSVAVALSGDGGDELFAGYDPFKALSPSLWLHRFKAVGVPALIRRAVAMMPLSDRNMSLDFKLRQWLRGADFPPALWNPVWMGALVPEEIGELFGSPISSEELYQEALETWEACESPSLMDRSLEFYTRFYLQENILTKIDRASMLVSLELRSPFLDNGVVDFASKLPHQLKFRNGQGKWLLKRALAGLLPNEVLYRRKKGFGMPLSRWLRVLPRPEAGRERELMDISWLNKRWDSHRAQHSDSRQVLWCWMVLNAFLSSAKAIPTR